MRWFVSAILAFPLWALSGQNLSLSPAAAAPGEQVSINLSLTSPPGREQPSTLQWEIALPIAQLRLVDENPPPGDAARAAGKSVSCKEKTRTAPTQTSICILYGGREPIRDGVVAVLKLEIAPDAQPGTATVRIDQALAVLKDLEKIPMDPVETVVTIRRKN